MIDEYDYIDLIDSSTTSSVAFPECSSVGVSHHGGVGWVPLSGSFLCFIIIYIFDMGSF